MDNVEGSELRKYMEAGSDVQVNMVSPLVDWFIINGSDAIRDMHIDGAEYLEEHLAGNREWFDSFDKKVLLQASKEVAENCAAMANEKAGEVSHG